MLRHTLAMTASLWLLAAVGTAWGAGGALLWSAQSDLAGGDESGRSIAVADGRVVLVGSSTDATGNSSLIVHVYDAKRGTLLWNDRVALPGVDQGGQAVVVKGRRVIVAGAGVDPAGIGRLLLRSYDARTGASEWTRNLSAITVSGLALDSGRLVVAGSTIESATGRPVPLISVHVLETGAPLWEDRSLATEWAVFTPPGVGFSFTPRDGVVVLGGTSYIAGTVRQEEGLSRCFVRAYDVKRGAVRWESVRGSGSNGGFGCIVESLAVDKSRVLLAGIGGAFTDDFNVHALDADTGDFIWLDRTTVSARNAAATVDVEGRRTFVGGWMTIGFAAMAFTLRAYDTKTGALLWEVLDSGTGARCECAVRALVVEKGRVVAVGQASRVSGQWMVRAYDADSGDLLWHDDPDIVGLAEAVAVADGRVVVSGSGETADDDTDLFVRSYDLK